MINGWNIDKRLRDWRANNLQIFAWFFTLLPLITIDYLIKLDAKFTLSCNCQLKSSEVATLHGHGSDRPRCLIFWFIRLRLSLKIIYWCIRSVFAIKNDSLIHSSALAIKNDILVYSSAFVEQWPLYINLLLWFLGAFTCLRH